MVISLFIHQKARKITFLCYRYFLKYFSSPAFLAFIASRFVLNLPRRWDLRWNIICAIHNPLLSSKWTPRTPEVLFLLSFLSFLMAHFIDPSISPRSYAGSLALFSSFLHPHDVVVPFVREAVFNPGLL